MRTHLKNQSKTLLAAALLCLLMCLAALPVTLMNAPPVANAATVINIAAGADVTDAINTAMTGGDDGPFEFVLGGDAYTLNATDITTTKSMTLKGATGGTTLSMGAGKFSISGTAAINVKIEGIEFTPSVASRTTEVISVTNSNAGSTIDIKGCGFTGIAIGLDAPTPVGVIDYRPTADTPILTVTDCDFTGNSGINGSCLFVASTVNFPKVTVDECNFTNNSVTGNGGSIYVGANTSSAQTGYVKILSSTFDGVYSSGATRNASFGGAISIDAKSGSVSPDVTIENCNFESLGAANGGAIDYYIQNSISNGILTVDNCLFSENAATGNGGAIRLRLQSSTATKNCIIRNSVFSDNQAASMGGAIHVAGGKTGVDVSGCTFTGNTAKNAATPGHAFYISTIYLTYLQLYFNTFIGNDVSNNAVYAKLTHASAKPVIYGNIFDTKLTLVTSSGTDTAAIPANNLYIDGTTLTLADVFEMESGEPKTNERGEFLLKSDGSAINQISEADYNFIYDTYATALGATAAEIYLTTYANFIATDNKRGEFGDLDYGAIEYGNLASVTVEFVLPDDFRENGGTGTLPETIANAPLGVAFSVSTGDLKLPACAFLGWHVVGDAGTPPTFPASEDGTTTSIMLSSDDFPADSTVTLLAVFSEPRTVTVSFLSDDGETELFADQEILADSTATKPTPDPTRSGYRFIGWYTAATGGSAYNFSTAVTADLALYARFTNTVTVTLVDYKNAERTATPTIGSTFTPENPANRTGYRFTGWKTDSNLTTAYTPRTITEDDHGMKLYAAWDKLTSYTISFVVDGSTTTATGYEGEPIPFPALEKTGYTLAWYDQPDGEGTEYTDADTVSGAITLYAHWTVKTYTVIFMSEGTELSRQTVNHGERVTDPGTPVRDGWYFTNWDSSLLNPITSDKTFTAQWLAAVRITFLLSEGGEEYDYLYLPVNYTFNFPNPSDEAELGTRFICWKNDNPLDENEYLQGGNYIVTSAATFYAVWDNIDYYVYFYKPATETNESGTFINPYATYISVGNKTCNYDQTVSLPETDPEISGYTFAGWFTTKTGDTAFTSSTPITANTNVYAQFTPNNYTATFVDGETETTANTVYGGYLDKPQDPTRLSASHNFVGWLIDGTETHFDFDFTQITGNLRLIADWQIKTYTVTFVVNGSAYGEPLSGIEHGTTLEGKMPANPASETPGEAFSGWLTENDALFSVSTPITANLILTASFDVATYTVTFYIGSEPYGEAQSGAYGFKATRPITDPTTDEPGMEFDNWYTAVTGGSVYDFDTEVTGDLSLYARFKYKSYTVTFNVEGAESTETVTHGDAVAKPANDPQKTGHTFDNWYAHETEGDTPYDFAQAVTGSFTLYARWTINTYTVTFMYGSESLGTVSGTYNTVVGSASDIPTPPTVTGKHFSGWFAAVTGGTAIDLNKEYFTSNRTLYAQYADDLIEVTFIIDNNTDEPFSVASVVYGNTVSRPSDPAANPGYTFDGWYLAGKVRYSFSTPVTAPLTLYATWNKNTVSYNLSEEQSTLSRANAGSAYNATIPAATCKDTLTYALVDCEYAWLSLSDLSLTGTPPADFFGDVSITVRATNDLNGEYAEASLSFYVRASLPDIEVVSYSVDKTSVTVTLSHDLSDYAVKYSLLVSSSAPDYVAFNLTDITFTLSTDSAGAALLSGTTYVFGISIEETDTYNGGVFHPLLTFETESEPEIFTVTFVFEDKENVTVSVTDGEKIPTESVPQPSDPADGYYFDGWYLKNGDTFGSKWVFETNTVTGNISLYAKYVAIDFAAEDITFDNIRYLGSASKSVTVTGHPGPFTFTVLDGDSLPDGFSLDAGTGEISATSITAKPDTYEATIEIYCEERDATITVTATFIIGKATRNIAISSITATADTITIATTPAFTHYALTTDGAEPSYTAKNDSAHTFTGLTAETEYTVFVKLAGDDYYQDTTASSTITTAEPESFTVRFFVAIDNLFSTKTVISGQTVADPGIPTLTGFDFKGWFTAAEDGSAFSLTTPITASIDIYAHWSPIYVPEEFDVTFINGETTTTIQVTEGDIIPAASVPEPAEPSAGFIFDGWYVFVNGEIGNKWNFESDAVTSDLTLKAQYVAINFSAEDISITNAVYLGTASATIVVTGYNGPFIFTVQEGSALPDGFSLNDETGEILASSITAKPNTYSKVKINIYCADNDTTITINANFVIGKATLNIEIYEDEVTDSEISILTNIEFTHYAISSGGGSVSYEEGSGLAQTFSGLNANTPYTVYVKIENGDYYKDTSASKVITTAAKVKHTVTFISNGATYRTQSVLDGEKATLPDEPTRDGFTFDGWYTTDGYVTLFDFDTLINAPTSVYAKWTQDAPVTYTVTFDVNGSTTTETVNHGEAVTKPADPTPATGYTFKGWFSAATGGTEYVFTSAVTSSFTLYAQWTIKTYTVTFDVDGSTTTETVNHGEAVTKPADPTPAEGYTFKGWFSAATGGTEYIFTSAVTANLTLYAQWAIKTYTVTFNVNGDTTTETVNHGEAVTKPTDPTPATGYTFKGWFSAATGGTEYIFTSAVTANFTLYAQWDEVIPEPTTYTVKFYRTENELIKTETVVAGNKVTKPADPTPAEGYTFKGWFSAATGGTEFDFNTVITANTSIYAQWDEIIPEPVTYTVTFISNGSTYKTETVVAGNKVTKPTDPTRDGYVFTGWYVDENGTNAFNFETGIDGNKTVYAQFTKKKSGCGKAVAPSGLAGMTLLLAAGAFVTYKRKKQH